MSDFLKKPQRNKNMKKAKVDGQRVITEWIKQHQEIKMSNEERIMQLVKIALGVIGLAMFAYHISKQ